MQILNLEVDGLHGTVGNQTRHNIYRVLLGIRYDTSFTGYCWESDTTHHLQGTVGNQTRHNIYWVLLEIRYDKSFNEFISTVSLRIK